MTLGLLIAGSGWVAAPAEALPPGRSWAPTQTIQAAGISSVRAARLEVDSAGAPLLIIGARRELGADKEWSVLGWRDSLWTPLLYTGVRQSFFPEPVLSLIGGQYLVWISTIRYPDGLGPLLLSRLLPSYTPPETVLTTFVQDSEYGAAITQARRWVARAQQRPGTFTNWVRVLYSDTVGVWRELPSLGIDEFMCTIAPLSDRSAIVAYSDGSGLNWAIADGDRWVSSGNLDPEVRFPPLHPRFRFRPSGGVWLMWTDTQSVHVSSFRNGVWERGDSVRCIHPEGETFWSAWSDMSRDPGERPVLAWGDLGVGRTFFDVGCVAFPTDSGWAPGEEIPDSRGLFLSPKVTRDRNGDAWLAWDMRGIEITRLAHTYVSATASAPAIDGVGRHRTLRWRLSEPAPESWWAVLRSNGGEEYEPVARLEAGAGQEMSWQDDSPPRGQLRYRIRRESVDSRYAWESAPAFWPAISRRPHLRLVSPGVGVERGSRIGFAIEGAVGGSVELNLYDLQGRLLSRQQPEVQGIGEGRVAFDLAGTGRPLAPGVYFVRALDGSGQASNAVKLVVLQ